MFNHLFFILIIIVIILLIKHYLESKNVSRINSKNSTKNTSPQDAFSITYDNANSFKTNNAEFNKIVEDMQKDTMRKINHAVEQGVIEGYQNSGFNSIDSIDNNNNVADFSDVSNDTDDITYSNDFDVKTIKSNSHKYKESNKNKGNNDNIISYLNKGNTVKLMLFYKASCPYCSDFMPVWYKIVNNLANTVLYEEIECEKDYKKANEYQITSVPTIILLVKNEKKVYTGDRNYSDILRFLKINGVNLIERTFEEFNANGYSATPEPTINNRKTLCPIVTFNSELEVAQDNYMFQIFNADGQYGYATGGNNFGKPLTPFTAAYSTVDSYLTSLPDGANISECANFYSEQIRGFGLCDKDQLDNILQYQSNVKSGTATPIFDDTDYSSNKGVITAIKNSCGL